MLLPGIPQTGVLVTLKASKRNSRRIRSVIGKRLNKERSRFFDQSDRNEFRPRSPKVNCAGVWKPAGLSQWCGDLSAGYGSPRSEERRVGKEGRSRGEREESE